MKFILIASFVVSSLHAATTSYNFTTGLNATASGIANSSGVAFQDSASSSFAGPGVIGVGFFNLTDAQISASTTSATLIAAFNNFNTNGTSKFNGPGPGSTGFRGVFSFNPAARDLTLVGGSSFAGKNMYVFVGNGTTFADSTEFLVLKSTFTFDTSESGTTIIPKTFSTTNSSVLIGSQVANVFTTGTDTSTTPGWQTATLVPEPSAALLGALSGLFILRRRRR